MIKRKKITLEERIDEITRRIDTLSTKLHASDSETRLSKISEHEKRINDIAAYLAMNDNEMRILRDSLFALLKTKYPNIDAVDLEKMRNALKAIFNKASS